MPETGYKEIPLTFEKGLVTEIEESTLDVGQAAELLNWEPAANGVLRARNRWESLSKLGLPTTYNVRGFGSIAVGAGSVETDAPVVVQTGKWPDGNQDMVATKTITLTGCTIGNVLVAVVADDSGLTPVVTAGWTQRAISTDFEQHVKFYTKTAAASTEAFTYTITTFRIRSVTVYEIQDLDAEDPGIKWAADSTLTGSGGTNTISVTATDADGGLAIVGTLYDGGTPNSAISGTAGMTSVIQDNANTRTGVTFDDLDNLDTSYEGVGGAGQTFVTPSWTPPDSGILLCILTYGDSGGLAPGPSIAGNGLTWTTQKNEYSGTQQVGAAVFSADLSQAGKSAGVLTITVANLDASMVAFAHFVRVIGGSTVDVIPQGTMLYTGVASANDQSGTALAALASGSAVIGVVCGWAFSGAVPTTNADLGAGQWTGVFDAGSRIGAGGQTSVSRVAYQAAGSADTNGGTFDFANLTASGGAIMLLEIAGTGNSSVDAHGTFTSLGSVVDQYTYIANKRITAKMVVWGYTPRVAGGAANQVNFYIVVALATDATTYKIYRLLRDEITTGTWELIDTVTDATSTAPLVAFAQGAGRLAWSSTSLTAPRSILLDPLTASNIPDLLGLAGRCLAYHKDRLFVSGSNANPSRVFFSDIGLPTTFVTVTDFLDIGGDDGEAVQETISVEGLLLVCKVNRLYLISGSGIESFFVNELPGGSAASGRPAIRTPYGTIVAGTDDIWVVQGGGVDPMSRPLGSGYEITGNVSTSYGQDTVLVCDSTTGQIWRVNLVTGAWGLEAVSGAEDVDPVFHLFSLNGRLYYGTNASTTDLGGKRQLSDARIHDETSGGTVYAAKTGKMALLGPQHKYTPRWLFLQVRNHTPTLPSPLTITITTDIGDPEVKPVMVTREVQRVRVDLGAHKGAEWIQVGLNAGASSVAGALDVEKAVLGALVERIR